MRTGSIGLLTLREFVYAVSIVAGFAASWYGLTSRVEKVQLETAGVARRFDDEARRIDELSRQVSEHHASPGHAVALEKTEELSQRVAQLEQRVEQLRQEFWRHQLPSERRRLSLLGEGEL